MSLLEPSFALEPLRPLPLMRFPFTPYKKMDLKTQTLIKLAYSYFIRHQYKHIIQHEEHYEFIDYYVSEIKQTEKYHKPHRVSGKYGKSKFRFPKSFKAGRIYGNFDWYLN